MKIVVVIPTYNEAQKKGHTLDELFEAIDKVFKTIAAHQMLVLVVDGNSPDGTADVVRSNQSRYPWLHLIVENKKTGLGAAYFFAFRHAMDELKADTIVEMDSDFQHDPNDLSRLIAPIDEGYDYVIGSRFMKGGSIPNEWAFYRRFLSFWGNIFTKIVLGLYNIDDFTTGFKATRVKGFLDKIDFAEIKSTGFAYKMELLFRMRLLGAKIIQIPIKFGVRDRGVSKMVTNNILDSLLLVLKLRIYQKKEFVKFCIVGSAGFITDATLFNLLSVGSIHPRTSAIISGIVAMTVTFILNNTWSFGSRKKTSIPEQLKSFPLYVGVSIVPILVRSKMVALSIIWFGSNFYIYNAAFIIGVFFGLIWNYLIYSRIVWKRH